jgi:hypothetical protein
MTTPLRVTDTLAVTPLLDVQTPAFTDTYRNGVWWALYGGGQGKGPQRDSYLVENLKRDARDGLLDGQHHDAVSSLGFYFGMVQGGILDPRTGQLRRHVATLVTFTHRDGQRGYHVARGEHFYYTERYTVTESLLIEGLCASAQDLLSTPHDEDGWYYSIGCLLGRLSVSLFPATQEEYRAWEKDYRDLLDKMRRDTEPLPSLPVAEYTV